MLDDGSTLPGANRRPAVGHPHVGPNTVRVLAEADYTHDGRTCAMPVAWTRAWGEGRVFYSALGHAPAEFDRWPDVFAMSMRGLLWAAGAL